MDTNLLWYGDNLNILREHIPDESVDLIYLDPPFNSNRAYNIIFKDATGKGADAQITAFDDTWGWGDRSEEHFRYLTSTLASGGRVPEPLGRLVGALRGFLQTSEMMAYVVEMAVRLVELHRVLKQSGSLYLHCDPTASHYLKLVMDSIFEPEHFRSEIVWKRSSAHSDTKQGRAIHGHIHDVILFYTKSDDWTWNPIYTPYDQSYVDSFYRHVEPETGRRYRLGDLTGPGGAAKGNPIYEVMGVTRYWRYTREKMDQLIAEGRVIQTAPGAVPAYKRYLDEMPGVPLQDMWTDLSPVAAQAAERLGYPTQKPLSLLERIIASSSNPGDLVLDPFCGCGTALVAAQKLNRKWIGIDVTYLSIAVMEARLRDTFGLDHVPMKGAPTELEGAKRLAEASADGRYEFQFWACSLVGASPVGGKNKKGMDRGIDGVISFPEPQGERAQIIVSVKSGHVTPDMIRVLKTVVDREQAAMGLFITLAEPTKEMVLEATTAGFYRSKLADVDLPKIQIVTIADLLAQRMPKMPPLILPAYQKATRAKESGGEAMSLFDEVSQSSGS